MATKEEVTEYIDYQFERGGNDYNYDEYYEPPDDNEIQGTWSCS